jgi:hypothetical protein
MVWSGFRMRLFDVTVNGIVWALLGAVSAVIVVRKVSGDWTLRIPPVTAALGGEVSLDRPLQASCVLRIPTAVLSSSGS